MNWSVLHVRPRCEKKLAEYCEYYHFEYYLPLRSETKVYQRRKVTVNKPVFPSYVFVNVEEDRRALLLQSNTVIRMIEVDNQDFFLWELDQIRAALTVDDTLGATKAFTRGKHVRVTDGPFRGLEGIVQSTRSGTRIVLNVDMIGQALRVDVEMHMLEPSD